MGMSHQYPYYALILTEDGNFVTALRIRNYQMNSGVQAGITYKFDAEDIPPGSHLARCMTAGHDAEFMVTYADGVSVFRCRDCGARVICDDDEMPAKSIDSRAAAAIMDSDLEQMGHIIESAIEELRYKLTLVEAKRRSLEGK